MLNWIHPSFDWKSIDAYHVWFINIVLTISNWIQHFPLWKNVLNLELWTLCTTLEIFKWRRQKSNDIDGGPWHRAKIQYTGRHIRERRHGTVILHKLGILVFQKSDTYISAMVDIWKHWTHLYTQSIELRFFILEF